MSRSLLVVNYRSAVLAREAVRSARAACSAPLQTVIVDNSGDAAEAEALHGAADVVVVSATNRGYAGGINDGRRHCRGEVLLIANPDVVFGAGSVDRLAEALDGRTAVSGPALFWDEEETWLLPPAELHSGWEKLDEVLASRAESWFEQRDRRRFRRRVAFWSLTETTEVRALSGAVLAIAARDFDAAGGFDERFALYFEETDFLRRIAAMQKRIVYVPAARCRHLYNQSAGQEEASAAARYATSELRYLEKWNGPFAARTLKRLERELRWTRRAEPRPFDPAEVVFEASPLPGFSTAAGHFPTGTTLEVPEDVWRCYRGAVLHLRAVVRTTGEVVATHARYRT